MAEAEDTMWWYRALHDRLVERTAQLRLPPGARVLDAGCGTGGLLHRLEDALPALSYTGIDLDGPCLEVAGKRTAASLHHGNVNSLPFPPSHFDAVVSADVLCQARVDEAAAVREFMRTLRPGASLLLNLPAYGWMRSSHDVHVHNVRRYTSASARRVVEAAGFVVAGAGYWNAFLLPFMALYRATVGRNKLVSDVRSFPRRQNVALYRVTDAERRLAGRGIPLPFGSSVWLLALKR